MEIPYDQLSPEALQGVIEAFVLREGTDYGSTETSLETKVAQIKRQLAQGKVQLVYDPDLESCNIIPVPGK